MDTKGHLQSYIDRLKARLDRLDLERAAIIIEEIQSLIGSEKTLFVCGNGGSAALASHIAADFGKTILGSNPRNNGQRMRVIALNDCLPALTAWANDEGYKYIFSEALRGLGRKGDVLLVITGSGNSENILEAMLLAKKMGIRVLSLLGFSGGKAKDLSDEYFLVEESDYGIVEDIHTIFDHMATNWLKSKNV